MPPRSRFPLRQSDRARRGCNEASRALRELEKCIECAVFLEGLPGWRGVELHDIEIVGFHPRKTLFDPGHDIVAREDVCPSLAARCRGCAHQTAAFAGQIIFGAPMRDIAANPLLAQSIID